MINLLIKHELEELTEALVGLGRHILDMHMRGQLDSLPSSGGVAEESLLVGVEKKQSALQRPITGTPFLWKSRRQRVSMSMYMYVLMYMDAKLQQILLFLAFYTHHSDNKVVTNPLTLLNSKLAKELRSRHSPSKGRSAEIAEVAMMERGFLVIALGCACACVCVLVAGEYVEW